MLKDQHTCHILAKFSTRMSPSPFTPRESLKSYGFKNPNPFRYFKESVERSYYLALDTF